MHHALNVRINTIFKITYALNALHIAFPAHPQLTAQNVFKDFILLKVNVMVALTDVSTAKTVLIVPNVLVNSIWIVAIV
jgi:hypothetical protein